MDKLPCPFCGSTNLDISVSSGQSCYYKQVYCKECHTYGPRYRQAPDRDKFGYSKRYEFEHDTTTDELAEQLWNNRK